MITKRERVRVAIFVLTFFFLILGTIGTLVGVRAAKPMKRYTVVTTSSVSGLNKSAAVNYLGKNVGTVADIGIGPGEVTLTIAVEEATPITSGTKAQLTGQGITGIQIIELIPPPPPKQGEPRPATLEAGSRIEFIPSSFQEIVSFFGENKGKVSDTIAHANVFIQTATAAVTSTESALERVSGRVELLLDEDRSAVKQLLDRTNTLVADVNAIVARLKERQVADELADTLATTKRTISDVDATVLSLNGRAPGENGIGDAIADLRSTARSAAEAANSARALLDRLSPGVQDDLESLRNTLEQVQRTVRNLEDLSSEVKTRPSLLLRDLTQPRRDIPDK